MEQKHFNTRAYNRIEVLPFGVIRKSSESDRLSDEISYYDSIPEDMIHFFPRKLGSSVSDKNYSLTLEYYPFKTLGEYMISNEQVDWMKVFSHLNGALAHMADHSRQNSSVGKNAVAMYVNKTKNEYENLKNSFYDSELFTCKSIVLNGFEYKNFETIWDRVKSVIETHLVNYSETMIHGDMCFSNILYHPSVGPRFIDMRGSFGDRGIYGDKLYDYAKLLHSVEGGYELFINDKFTATKMNRGIYEYWLYVNKNKEQALSAYLKTFENENIHLIRLVEGLIFVGMCARHYDSKERQLIMYLTGVKNLNEALENI